MENQYWYETPATVEQTLLAELQRKNQQFLSSLHSLPNIPVILHSIDQYEQSLYNLVPHANWLSSQGFPRLAQQLNFVFRDLSGARMTYYQMYQNALIQQSQMQRIWMDTNTAVTKNILDATNYQIRASHESTQDFLDFMEGTPIIRVRW